MKVFTTPKFNHPGFNFFLRRSTYVHSLLVLCTLTGGKIAFDIQQKVRDRNLELIQASVRVDMVAMPTNTINELKNMSSGVEEAKKETKAPEVEEKTVAKEKEEPKEKVVEKDDPTDKTEALQEAQVKKRLDFLSKLKKIGDKKVEAPKEGTLKAEKGLNGSKDTALKNLVLSGNKLNKGTQMFGDGNAVDMPAFHVYISKLPDYVRQNWSLPQYLLDKKLKARVQVWLSMSGEVTRAEIYQKSGDSDYDQRALEAVKATRFPPLKEEFAAKALKGDIVLGFPL